MARILLNFVIIVLFFPNISLSIPYESLQNTLQAHGQLDLKKVEGYGSIYDCGDDPVGHVVQMPLQSDCGVFDIERPIISSTGNKTYTVFTASPNVIKHKIHQCQKVKIKYSADGHVFSSNTVTVLKKEYTIPTKKECDDAPISLSEPVLDSSCKFYQSLTREADYVRKVPMIVDFITIDDSIFIPDSGMYVDAKKMSYTSENYFYSWSEVDTNRYIQTHNLICKETDSVKDSRIDKSLFCPESNQLFLFFKNRNMRTLKGVSVEQSYTGEYFQTSNMEYDRENNLVIEYEHADSVIEGEGFIMNSMGQVIKTNALLNKCWHRNSIIAGLKDGMLLRADEVKILTDVQDTIGLSYPSQGYMSLKHCKPARVLEYSRDNNVVILKTEGGKIGIYSPSYLFLDPEKVSPSRPILGSSIPLLGTDVLDLNTGVIKSLTIDSVHLYNYGKIPELAAPKKYESLWHPDNIEDSILIRHDDIVVSKSMISLVADKFSGFFRFVFKEFVIVLLIVVIAFLLYALLFPKFPFYNGPSGGPRFVPAPSGTQFS